MIKSIQLKLLKYSGGSIGDDIRVEIDIAGQFLRIDKTIKVGAIAAINEEIGKFETDQKLFKADVKIVVIEKDALFNDVGDIVENIKIDTDILKPQLFIYRVQIKETHSILGKFWGKKTANFEITLEVNVEDAVQYVSEGKYGWLNAKFEDNQSIESLPVYLKVKPEYIDNGREYFIILEGAYRDRRASFKLGDSGASNLISGIKHESEVRVIYSISRKTLILNGKKYAIVDYKSAPWKKGLYDIEIPDYPHSGGARYEKKAPRAKTWFRIGHDGERYLHTGGRSLGCITVIEIIRWVEIYDVLIKARKNDSVSVGVLEVVD